MSLPAKRCGRPPVLSFLEKKKRKQSLDRRRGKTRIYVGNHIERWLTLKEKLDFRNDAEVAGFLLDLYDSYDPLSKAPLCPLPEGVRRITVKEERALSGSTSLIAADGTYDNAEQLHKESACSGLGDVRVVTVKEERETPQDCVLARADDTSSCHSCSDSLSENVLVHSRWSSSSEAKI
ncbi:zinc finger protein 692-like isoform X3 [Manacus vitellinus]|uniref:zinc finger protein 692-like isoform X3 n=1 Tax=Manacus vitellinus TaxID=328815 RepID=UPI0008478F29|nr:zinc finger protein 692-like isoform X3 [Manacus vitellinus]